MGKTEIVLDDWKLVRVDQMNWQVFERREVKPKDGPPRVDWVGLPAFFGDIGHAARYMLQRAFGGSGYVGDLAGAVEEFGRIADNLEKSVTRAVESLV